jgi:hypothetical protein
MARLALILHWWNPLAWTAWRAFLAERERAADDLVLRTDTCASDYARHLLEIARVMQSGPALGWAAVAMARRSQLEGRLLAILDSRTNRKPAGRSSALAAALVPIALIAPLAAIRAQGPLSSAIPADVDATIRAAVAQKNSEMVEKPAAAFEVLRQYDASRRLLDSAAAIHEQVSGARSEDYGRALLKLGDLERKRYRSRRRFGRPRGDCARPDVPRRAGPRSQEFHRRDGRLPESADSRPLACRSGQNVDSPG